MNGYGLMSGLNEGMTNFLNAYVKMREIKNADADREQKLEQAKLDRELRQKELESKRFDKELTLREKGFRLGEGGILERDPEAVAREQRAQALEVKKAGLLEERDPTTGQFKAFRLDPEKLQAERRIEQLKQATARPQKFNEGQWKAAGFGRRMESADQIIQSLEADPEFDVASPKIRAQKLLPTMLGGVKDPKVQMFEQAQRDFINAVLRRESGATITPEEFANAEQQYFPQPGDSKEVLEQKRINRMQATQNLKTESAGAVDLIPSVRAQMLGERVQGQAPQAGGLLGKPAPFKPGDRRMKNGVTFERQADGTWKAVR